MINIDIDEIIPHRDRMKLIQEILEADNEKAITASVVNERWPLYSDNAVNPIVLVEIVAQTAGIAAGYKNIKETGKGVEGWVVGIKKADFFIDKILSGTRLISKVELLYDHDTYGVFHGSVTSEAGKLAEMDIQILRTG